MTSFDTIAEGYRSSTPKIPAVYINFIAETMNLHTEDKVLELGCGTGEIAIALSKKSNYVTGLDISTTMLDLAKKEEGGPVVEWIIGSADKFDFGENKYKLIIAFDSFHLFPNHPKLIGKISKALKPGGFFAVGWAMYEWDMELKEIIHDVFIKHNINRPAWGLWTCPNLKNEIVSYALNLGLPNIEEFNVQANTPVNTIVEYILNNSKSIKLNSTQKKQIRADLITEILKVYPSGESEGQSKYSILYSLKY